MSRDNTELLRRSIDWWSHAQRDRVPDDMFDPDIEISGRLSTVAGEPYRGLAGVGKWIGDIQDQFEVWEVAIEEIRPLDDGSLLVLGKVHAEGRGSGVPLDWQAGLLAEFRAGRILRLTIYGSVTEALKAVEG
jgi:hypothetical protein